MAERNSWPPLAGEAANSSAGLGVQGGECSQEGHGCVAGRGCVKIAQLPALQIVEVHKDRASRQQGQGRQPDLAARPFMLTWLPAGIVRAVYR